MTDLTSFTDILRDPALQAVFVLAPCDFCPAFSLTYTDPETQGRYCLPCLEVSTEPLADGPEDPEITAIAREVIAARRASRIAKAA